MLRSVLCGVAAGVLCAAAISALRAEPAAIAGASAARGYEMSGAMVAPGYCQVTVTPVAQSLLALLAGGLGQTCAPPSWATWAEFTPENGAIIAVRCAADGTTVSASLGDPLFGNFKNPEPVTPGLLPGTLSCISATGSNVTMNIRWLG